MVTYEFKTFKTAFNSLKYIDSWFWTRYTLNPYNGCQIGCVYCNSRSAKYHLPLEFEKNIVVKQDLAYVLDQQIRRSKNMLPDVFGLSGTTDPYQNSEKKYRNTRACLEVLKEHRMPVHVITKSRLVTEDLELLDEIGKNSWATVSISITTDNKKLAKFLEKGAPYPIQRLELLETIKNNYKNIQTGILIIPLIPFLTDSKQSFEELIKLASSYKPDYIQVALAMTMRDVQARWYLLNLKKEFPDLIEKYEKIYSFKYDSDTYTGSEYPNNNYLTEKKDMVTKILEKYKIKSKIDRYLPNDYRRLNYIVAEELFKTMSHWELNTKKYWLAHEIQNLKTSITYALENGENFQNLNEELSTEVNKITQKHKKNSDVSLGNWF